MLIIKQEELTILPNKKVICPSEYAILVANEEIMTLSKETASYIILKANQKAAEIIQDAKNKAADIIKDSKSIYKSEKQRGYDEGIESGKEEMAIQMMDLVTKSVTGFAKFEEEIVGVVIRAIRRIIGEIDRTELITNVVKNALKIVKNQKHATLKVSNVELKLVRDNIEKIKKDFPSLEYIDVFADPNLRAGSCLLETEFGLVDASIEVQLEAIKKSLYKNLVKHNG